MPRNIQGADLELFSYFLQESGLEVDLARSTILFSLP
jgi:hypothetical protein